MELTIWAIALYIMAIGWLFMAISWLSVAIALYLWLYSTIYGYLVL